jgi:hypothetical protein
MQGSQKRMIKGLLPVIIGLVVIAVVVIVIPRAVKFAGKASGTQANLIINYEGILGSMPVPWRNLAQGGEDQKDMVVPVINEVKDLKPEYIRIDHIYDAYKVVSRNDGQLTYDWARLDGAVDSILKTGAKPMLSLSYMPEAISKGDILALPNDWNDWGAVVQATIEHYSGRSQKNIDGVAYEVWNEPDLFGSYKTSGEKNYLDMYEASARAASRVRDTNLFEIGGPAVTALYQNWLEKIINFVDQKNLRLDFVSWHRYSTDLDQFAKDANQARDLAGKIPALVNLKFYVTEWGFNSEVDKGYDTKYGAIHLLAASRAMMGAIDRAFVFEIKDGVGSDKLWGRWGLLTNEKFGTPEKKPRYDAIMLLNSLYSTRIGVSGEGSWVKSIGSVDNNGNMKVLVVNYDPQGSHGEAVPITFDNLPKQNFKYSRTDFMGTSRNLNVATTSASWKTTEYMEPNSATMISIDF